jgi:hypothetical protein
MTICVQMRRSPVSSKSNARDLDQNPRASLPRRSQFWTRGALTSLQQPARPQRLKPLPTDRQSSWYVPHAPVCDDKNALLLTFVKPPAGKQKKKWSKGKGTQTPSSILRAHRIQPRTTIEMRTHIYRTSATSDHDMSQDQR